MQTSYPNFIVIPERQAQYLISCSQEYQHRIIPTQLGDGRYVISSDVLSESSGIYSHIFEQVDLSKFEQITHNEFNHLLPEIEEPE